MNAPIIRDPRTSFVRVAGTLLVLGTATGAASAAELDASSRIDRVTLYPDGASVTRVAQVHLPAGSTTLVFKGLPLSLDPGSLRVEGQGSASFSIVSTHAELVPATKRPTDSAIDSRLRDLRSQREGWQVTINALSTKAAMIRRFAQAGPEKIGADAAPLAIDQWPTAWDSVGKAMAKVGDELRSARASARDLDDQITALEARAKPPSLGPQERISVEVQADAAVTGTLALTYRVRDARWTPAYDARLTTGASPRLDLVRRAIISQQTGEDWQGVHLALSTVRTVGATQAPDVHPQKVVFAEPPVVFSRKMSAAPTVAKDAAREKALMETRPEAVAAVPRAADLDAGDYQAQFDVSAPVDLPSDGSTRDILVSSHALAPTVGLTTAPALDPRAFLDVAFKDDEQAPLLAGPVQLERDGTLVGRGRLALTPPGETVHLGFGVDDDVKVTRAPVRKKENEPTWFNQTRIETRDFRTSVKNLHDFPVQVRIVDQVPVSENSAITVETLSVTTPANDKKPDDGPGVLAWSYQIAPGESRDVRLAWRMKWPAGRDVSVQPVRN